MIYRSVPADAPIRQGDLFKNVPRVDVRLLKDFFVPPDSETELSWLKVAERGIPVTAELGVRPVPAIVISQDCDIDRGGDITLCEIAPFGDVEGKFKSAPTAGTKKWREWFVTLVTQHAKVNQKWFYLPADPTIGFSEKMAANFTITIRLNATELQILCPDLRIARLKSVARSHLRERVADFFRRYPGNDWYPLDKDEFEEYELRASGAKPYPWQK